MVSILTRPEGRVQPVDVWATGLAVHVSILTRPEGRVQRLLGATPGRISYVSILTRPEGRVQRPQASGQYVFLPTFQSSPDPKAGCNIRGVWGAARVTMVSILTRPEGRVQHEGCLCGDCGYDVSILTRP